ncbi:MAG: Bug family tripartite tricarboxylate transporter substrate binding protein [Burkholderiaceae bacterium]
MLNIRKIARNACLPLLLLSCWHAPLKAQGSYPDRPIRLMVGLSAGGPSDLLARTIATGLQKELGGTIAVENRAGAGGIVAASAVIQAPADGYTIQFAAMPAVVFVPLLNSKLPYQQERDFVPIGPIASYSLFLFASPELPAKNMKELFALAKSKPGELTFGSGGNGTSNHLSGELMKRMANIDIVHVPYKGNVTAQQDVIAGRVSMMFDFLSTTRQFVDTGRLRILATTGKSRSRFAPDVPTLEESGLSGFDLTAWFGLFVKAGTPKPIIDKLNAALRAALATSEMQQQLTAQGYDVMAGSSEELAERIKADFALWTPVIKSAGITTN